MKLKIKDAVLYDKLLKEIRISERLILLPDSTVKSLLFVEAYKKDITSKSPSKTLRMHYAKIKYHADIAKKGLGIFNSTLHYVTDSSKTLTEILRSSVQSQSKTK